jgi:hypothetical protein
MTNGIRSTLSPALTTPKAASSSDPWSIFQAVRDLPAIADIAARQLSSWSSTATGQLAAAFDAKTRDLTSALPDPFDHGLGKYESYAPRPGETSMIPHAGKYAGTVVLISGTNVKTNGFYTGGWTSASDIDDWRRRGYDVLLTTTHSSWNPLSDATLAQTAAGEGARILDQVAGRVPPGGKVWVIGHSSGGEVAQNVYAEAKTAYPELDVRGIALGSPNFEEAPTNGDPSQPMRLVALPGDPVTQVGAEYAAHGAGIMGVLASAGYLATHPGGFATHLRYDARAAFLEAQ